MGIEAKYEGLPCDCDCTEGECQHCLHRAEIVRLRAENERLRAEREEALEHREDMAFAVIDKQAARVAELEEVLREILTCAGEGRAVVDVALAALEKIDED